MPTTMEIDDGWVMPPALVAELAAERDRRAAAPRPLDLNAATVADLMALPAIGKQRAERIVAARERAGGFASVDDLSLARGIGRKTIDQLRALVSV